MPLASPWKTSSMADWPREIKPEDRIRYLVMAREEILRHGVKGQIRSQGGVFMAMVGDHLVGEFDTIGDAEKALIDYEVVTGAVQQAWEDLAS